MQTLLNYLTRLSIASLFFVVLLWSLSAFRCLYATRDAWDVPTIRYFGWYAGSERGRIRVSWEYGPLGDWHTGSEFGWGLRRYGGPNSGTPPSWAERLGDTLPKIVHTYTPARPPDDLLPRTRYRVVLPYWAVLPLTMVLPVAWLRRRRRLRRRETGGRCLRCGYDLRASPGTCPECGAPSLKS